MLYYYYLSCGNFIVYFCMGLDFVDISIQFYCLLFYVIVYLSKFDFSVCDFGFYMHPYLHTCLLLLIRTDMDPKMKLCRL